MEIFDRIDTRAFPSHPLKGCGRSGTGSNSLDACIDHKSAALSKMEKLVALVTEVGDSNVGWMLAARRDTLDVAPNSRSQEF
jgi:hypothetical protein